MIKNRNVFPCLGVVSDKNISDVSVWMHVHVLHVDFCACMSMSAGLCMQDRTSKLHARRLCFMPLMKKLRMCFWVAVGIRTVRSLQRQDNDGLNLNRVPALLAVSQLACRFPFY